MFYRWLQIFNSTNYIVINEVTNVQSVVKYVIRLFTKELLCYND